MISPFALKLYANKKLILFDTVIHINFNHISMDTNDIISNDNTIKSVVLSSHIEDYAHINDVDISELSTEQTFAYHKFNKGANLFITGPGGTGKTRLIQYLLKSALANYKSIQICAMTGCAAILLNCNARTLHSWSGIKLARGPSKQIVDSVLRNKKAVAQWRRTRCLILDEVSMLSKKIFDIIEEIARKSKKIDKPFGGMQVIFTGDFYQLPPVGDNNDPDTSRFCFESANWTLVFPSPNQIELTNIFRQTDTDYIRILQQVRIGQIKEEGIQTLKTCLSRTYDAEQHNNCVPTKLFPLRSKTDYVNTMMFGKIQEKEFVFNAVRKKDCYTHIETNKPLSLDARQRCTRLSTAEIDYELDQMMNNTPCVNILRLKIGAAVMCTINLDMNNSICNGSQGTVTDIIKNDTGTTPVVLFANGVTKTILPHYWQSEDYPSLAIGQYPLCLAWALTIHKIQGATLDMAEIDIGQSIFEYGQTYVALSRVQSLHGLYLSEFQPQKIRANPIVQQFYMNFPKNDMNMNEIIETPPDNELKEETYEKSNIKTISLL